MATIKSTELNRIGDGPVATVFSGHHAGVPVALKVYPKRFDKRTLSAYHKEQAKLTALRRVTSILPVDAVDELDTGLPALRMEMCGQSLAGLIDRYGPMAPADAVLLGRAIATALAAAHERGVVHGGISPHNVLFRTSGEPVLADFGVTLRHAFARDPLHAIEFLPPETLRTGELTESSDLYGLGAILHYALTARSPHPGRLGEQPGERVLRILGEPVPAINNQEVPIGLSTLVARLLAADVRRRPNNTSTVAAQLGDMLPNPPQRQSSPDFEDDFDTPVYQQPRRYNDEFDDFSGQPVHPSAQYQQSQWPPYPQPHHQYPPPAPQQRPPAAAVAPQLRPPVAPPVLKPPPPVRPQVAQRRQAPGSAPAPAPPTPPTQVTPKASAPPTQAVPPTHQAPVAPPTQVTPSAGVPAPVVPVTPPAPRAEAQPPRQASAAPPAQVKPERPAAPAAQPAPVAPETPPAQQAPKVEALAPAAPPAQVKPEVPAAPPVQQSPPAEPVRPPQAGAKASPPVQQAPPVESRLAEQLRAPAPPRQVTPPAEVPAPVTPPMPKVEAQPQRQVPGRGNPPVAGSAPVKPPPAAPPVLEPPTTEVSWSMPPRAPEVPPQNPMPEQRTTAMFFPPPVEERRRRIRYDLLAGAGLVLALLALIPLLFLRNDPEELQTTPQIPEVGPQRTGDVEIVLNEPVDLTNKVELSWRASIPKLNFAVVIAVEGEEDVEVRMAERNMTMTVDVRPGVQYCFLVQAIEASHEDDVYQSNSRGLRGATCNQ